MKLPESLTLTNVFVTFFQFLNSYLNIKLINSTNSSNSNIFILYKIEKPSQVPWWPRLDIKPKLIIKFSLA